MRKRRPTREEFGDCGHMLTTVHEREMLHELGPLLCGGDVDADWARAESAGDEGVGGSTATPDQDVVDELGCALGVEQEADAELRITGDILNERDQLRWRLEAVAADLDDGRRPRGHRRR
jgi:Family of unknown function (DUF6335)